MAQDEELRYIGPDVVITDDPSGSGDKPRMTEAEMVDRLEPGAHMAIKDGQGWRTYDAETNPEDEAHP